MAQGEKSTPLMAFDGRQPRAKASDQLGRQPKPVTATAGPPPNQGSGGKK